MIVIKVFQYFYIKCRERRDSGCVLEVTIASFFEINVFNYMIFAFYFLFYARFLADFK